MKLQLLCLISLCAQIAMAAESPKAKAFDPQEPPFYTMDLDEIANLRTPQEPGDPDQRADYFKVMIKSLARLQAAKGHPFAPIKDWKQLDALSKNADAWHMLSSDIYYACQGNAANKKACESLEQGRVDALEQNSADRGPKDD